MSIQDLTYDDIEKRYPQLNGIVDLIIEDEGHKHYGGEKTSKRLRFLEEVPILTLSATPYNIMDNFLNIKNLEENILSLKRINFH